MNKRRRWIAKHRRGWKKSVKPYMSERLVWADDDHSNWVPIRFMVPARTEKEAQRKANDEADSQFREAYGRSPDWVRDAVVLYCTFW